MLVNILSAFRFAHGGIRVVEYRPGSAVDLLAEVAECAISEGWAEPCSVPSISAEPETADPDQPLEQPAKKRRGRRK